MQKITILKDAIQKPEVSDNTTIITFDKLKSWIKQGKIIKHLFGYQEAEILTYHLAIIPKPFQTAVLLKLLSRNTCHFRDEQGFRCAITIRFLSQLFWQLIKDYRRKPKLIQKVHCEVEDLIKQSTGKPQSSHRVDLLATPVYLRTDLWFGVRSGGSVGHIAGVLNNLGEFADKPVFLTTDTIPTVRTGIETHVILPDNSYWNFKELPSFQFNEVFGQNARKLLNNKKLSFIYQRYSINNYSGVKLSTYYRVPFVLEYNGSEIWINRNWGKPLKYEFLSERIELLNLKAADVVVVVSQPMKDELVARGIGVDKILVNPNGVDPNKYFPNVDGSKILKQYNLNRKTTVGFIGTFGRWHGAEVLAEAFGRLLHEFPEYTDQVQLFMIGDGETMPQVKKNLQKYNITDACVFTGLVPQEEGPGYLAVCDILVSPHVPNPDGTPFFGSPTKLFEYMAMGKGIVASDLDQIGEVLKHGQTAWMVKPGDPESLMYGLKSMVDDNELRQRLGNAARQEVIEKYTWKEHTRKIIEKLEECCEHQALSETRCISASTHNNKEDIRQDCP
ncbi:MAG: glycosyltransferase [Candidatus Jettenia sp.]|nr:MAG: glycosyltransferase [Candidatus Jettenia sp.]